ncbi:MAG TPA: hypothetical protein DCZ03_01260 [Gammaproteobacteria bacterium]|nr:hypothetical protein [Gammaproteobacteria bacterium]
MNSTLKLCTLLLITCLSGCASIENLGERIDNRMERLEKTIDGGWRDVDGPRSEQETKDVLNQVPGQRRARHVTKIPDELASQTKGNTSIHFEGTVVKLAELGDDDVLSNLGMQLLLFTVQNHSDYALKGEDVRYFLLRESDGKKIRQYTYSDLVDIAAAYSSDRFKRGLSTVKMKEFKENMERLLRRKYKTRITVTNGSWKEIPPHDTKTFAVMHRSLPEGKYQATFSGVPALYDIAVYDFATFRFPMEKSVTAPPSDN